MHGAGARAPAALLRQRQRGGVVRLQDSRRDVQPARHDLPAAGGLRHGARTLEESGNTDGKRRGRPRGNVQQPGVLLQAAGQATRRAAVPSQGPQD